MIPKKFMRRLEARGVFLGRSINWHKNGYWVLEPLPTQKDLQVYYQSIYWGDKNLVEGVFHRDLDHYLLIKELAPSFFTSPKTFLNFGSGHGGISHLMWNLGNRVINVEPSNVSLAYSENWSKVNVVDEVIDKVDFVYGSHSLEHVPDIEKFMNKLKELLNPGGLMFFEVPNGGIETDQGNNRSGKPPHTYYFTKSYFDGLPFHEIVNDYYKEGTYPYRVSTEQDGEVIRYFASMP
jgi:2-polyprenyl-3-methyl-5-hydroxy-6-metoxy-1,4-benzoquinol methylase